VIDLLFSSKNVTQKAEENFVSSGKIFQTSLALNTS
jgi:hypothetical protein